MKKYMILDNYTKQTTEYDHEIGETILVDTLFTYICIDIVKENDEIHYIFKEII